MSIPAKDISGTTTPLPFLLPVERELQDVESVLTKEVFSNVTTLAEAAGHILLGGGKRIRPALVALSAKACSSEYDHDRVVHVAAAVELIHMATLMHDDVVDGAEFRRGLAAANTVWGDRVSVLAGDFMLAKAFSLIARVAELRVLDILSAAAVTMAEGEGRQIESGGGPGDLEKSCLAIVHDKTAAFMSACCRIGAVLASSPPPVEIALADYGEKLGMAFQITDDLLDLFGDTARIGKPVGSDLREGKLTLPVIIAMGRAEPSERARIERVLQSEEVLLEDVQHVRHIVQRTGALERMQEISDSFVQGAVERLSVLKTSEASKALTALADYVTARDH